MRTLLALLLLTATLQAAEEPRVLKPAEAGVGTLISDVSFTDLAGKAGKLSDFKSSKFLVIAITSDTCPLSKKYVPTLAKLEKEFAPQGVTFLFVNPPRRMPSSNRHFRAGM